MSPVVFFPFKCYRIISWYWEHLRIAVFLKLFPRPFVDDSPLQTPVCRWFSDLPSDNQTWQWKIHNLVWWCSHQTFHLSGISQPAMLPPPFSMTTAGAFPSARPRRLSADVCVLELEVFQQHGGARCRFPAFTACSHWLLNWFLAWKPPGRWLLKFRLLPATRFFLNILTVQLAGSIVVWLSKSKAMSTSDECPPRFLFRGVSANSDNWQLIGY